jgi:transposase
VGRAYAPLVVLGYSRLLRCRFYPRQDIRTLVGWLEEAFRYFGGVPQELRSESEFYVPLTRVGTKVSKESWEFTASERL